MILTRVTPELIQDSPLGMHPGVLGHIVMVVIARRWNFVSIISGWKRVEQH
jgi:hypothetical protein